MIDLLTTLFYTFIALGSLVTFHEYGHFWVARRCGVKVETFSIGFGKALFRWYDKQGTEFILAALPLGGYVKMLDERAGEVSVVDKPMAFSSKTPWQRMAIIAAGPAANFLLAGVIFWFVFLGGESGLAPVVGEVSQDSMAEQAGFESGMEIIEIAGDQVESWGDVSQRLFDFIGIQGDIEFSVVYPDSDLVYEIVVPVNDWLSDAEAPMPLQDLGLTPAVTLDALTIISVEAGSAAARDGLLANDQVLRLDGAEILSTKRFVDTISESPDKTLNIAVSRIGSADEATEIELFVTPDSVDRDGEKVGVMGVRLSSSISYDPENIRTVDYNLLTAVPRAINEVTEMSSFVVKSIFKLLAGELSPKNLSGPITIAKVAGDQARSGLDNFVRFVAILSIMLGVMNLLPIPVLDGGHLVFIVIELIKGSPVSDAVQLIGYKAGFAMLVSLMIFATFNDLTRSF
ncbi:RIP metalloprotease RseP [Porticoccaceae bacterium]|nr:RIP metalloprotease RseP [Porticoccaceae bacterium]MDB2634457.1 RIP metalloprotease RseP [Porticoccaceae bacterium]